MRPWTMSRLIVVTSVVFCFSLKAEVRRERIFCERQERREALGARHLFSAEPQVARAWRKKMRGVRADAPHTTRLAARAFDPCTRALFTASGIDTPNARLTHGTERSRSRWSERTRGAVSVTDGLNAIDFCAEFRSAIAPDDAPVARRVATPDMAHSGSLVGRRLMKGAAQDGKQGHLYTADEFGTSLYRTAGRYFRASVARTIAQRINGIVVSTTTHRVHSRRSLK